MVGQHAMYGGGGFAPHTIQSPPIGRVEINGTAVSELGMELALFRDTRFLAVIGDAAAVREAQALCPGVSGFAVKDLDKGRFPTAPETFPGIKETVARALSLRDEAPCLALHPPFRIAMSTVDGWHFDPEARFPGQRVARFWFRRLYGGAFREGRAEWGGKRLVSCIGLVYMMRMFIVRDSGAAGAAGGPPSP